MTNYAPPSVILQHPVFSRVLHTGPERLLRECSGRVWWLIARTVCPIGRSAHAENERLQANGEFVANKMTL